MMITKAPIMTKAVARGNWISLYKSWTDEDAAGAADSDTAALTTVVTAAVAEEGRYLQSSPW